MIKMEKDKQMELKENNDEIKSFEGLSSENTDNEVILPEKKVD